MNNQNIRGIFFLVIKILDFCLCNVNKKVGTAVVTGKGGRLALGRLGALCEQVIVKF